MEILSGILIAITGLLMVMLLRLVTTFFHEMGHAIPALAFTDKPVEVYVGSYGDISKTLQMQFGRLKMFFKLNIFEWQIGLCRREGKVKSNWQRAIIIIGGPIASLLISIPLIFKLKDFQSHEILFFACIVFIVAAIVDLFVNLYPFASPMQMHDGGIAFSDGYQLRNLITQSFLPEAYFELQKLYEEEKYEELSNQAERLIEENPKTLYAYDFIVLSLIEQKEHLKIIEVYNYKKQHLRFQEEDFFIIGKTYRQLDKYDDALLFLNKYYQKNYSNPELIVEMAECHIAMGNYSEAIVTLDAILHSYPLQPNCHLIRAKALIKNNDLEAAKISLDIAQKFDQKNPMVYIQYGLLYKKMGLTVNAISNLEKAKEMNSEYPGLEFMIEQMR